MVDGFFHVATHVYALESCVVIGQGQCKGRRHVRRRLSAIDAEMQHMATTGQILENKMETPANVVEFAHERGAVQADHRSADVFTIILNLVGSQPSVQLVRLLLLVVFA